MNRYLLIVVTGLVLFVVSALRAQPNPAANPDPGNGAVDIPLDATLSWTGDSTAWWYNIYFGTTNPPPYITFQAETEYAPGPLQENTTYYWKINPGNGEGETEGELWSFTTTNGGGEPPEQVTDPIPENHAESVNIPFTLNWAAADRADSYNVYYGTQSNPPLLGTTTATSMPPNTMSPVTDYYWRVNSINEYGETVGELWTFTTEYVGPPIPGPATNPSPEDQAENVVVSAILGWDPADNAAAYSVNFGTQSNPPYVGSTDETTFNPGQLEPNTDYYWRISPFNESGTYTGTVWTFSTEIIDAAWTTPALPVSTELEQPYPNPFNAETTIPFSIASSEHVTLSIYDITGREIAQLANSTMPAGKYSVKWNSNTTSSGVYFVRLTTGNEIRTAKMLSLK